MNFRHLLYIPVKENGRFTWNTTDRGHDVFELEKVVGTGIKEALRLPN